MNSEEAFLFATFKEFHKCWRSGTKARVIIESVNGKAFVNFSAFLGNPDDAHFKPRSSNRTPSKEPRKKSDKKIKRDNDRAARFQDRKRREAASVSKPDGNPEAMATTSSPGVESTSDLEFSFASPVPEILRQNTSHDQGMTASDKKEDQRAQNSQNAHKVLDWADSSINSMESVQEIAQNARNKDSSISMNHSVQTNMIPPSFENETDPKMGALELLKRVEFLKQEILYKQQVEEKLKQIEFLERELHRKQQVEDKLKVRDEVTKPPQLVSRIISTSSYPTPFSPVHPNSLP